MKCQGAAAREWLAERQAELLPVPLCSVEIYVLASALMQYWRPSRRV
jgi:hypothetical protein